MKKLEWLGYPMMKKNEDMFIRFDTIHAVARTVGLKWGVGL